MFCAGRGDRGVTIIAVAFILAAIGVIGLTLSSITQNLNNRASEAVDVQRAYFTALSGYEWAIKFINWNLVLDEIARIEGVRTLPNGESFTLEYDPATDTLFSTATVGSATRRLRYSGFIVHHVFVEDP